jgi:hypothetical protein
MAFSFDTSNIHSFIAFSSAGMVIILVEKVLIVASKPSRVVFSSKTLYYGSELGRSDRIISICCFFDRR